jgi:3-hydroxyacyl-[acyl-carrier-protein] dehydratase
MEATPTKRAFDIIEIQQIIPHRPPFLLIDRIIETDCATYVEAVKNVSINEWFFEGHFPGAPVMPGVLIVEAMAQAAAIVVLANPAHRGKIPFFMTIDEAKFRKPVLPGDVLHIRIDLLRMRATAGKAKAVATVNGTVVTEAVIAFAIGEPVKKA